MKTIAALIVLAITGFYGACSWALSAGNASRFLDDMETLSLHARMDAYCARLADELEVSIRDRTADPPAEFDGGKPEFCAYVTAATRNVALLGLATAVTRNDFTVTRDWLRPWTVRVHYREDRTTTTRQFAPVHTQGEDDATLVLTVSGIQLRRLDSRSWSVDP
ncbi:MAG TPA: hypothetical protein VMF52_06925 [Steroidobacteraceae bacterium]|nr:hypothetical protein [Steroidobacteraceae bacterium]